MEVTETSKLIDRAQKGDRAAFHTIVNESRDQLFQLAYRMLRNHHDAEDALQEVYIKAYKALANFRRESSLSSWLYRITMNVCLDRKRSGKVVRLSLDGEAEKSWEPQEEHPTGDPHKGLQGRDIRESIAVAMTSLTPFERAVFSLRHEKEMSLKEIAQDLDRAEGTVKNILFRAVHKLRNHLSAFQSPKRSST